MDVTRKKNRLRMSSTNSSELLFDLYYRQCTAAAVDCWAVQDPKARIRAIIPLATITLPTVIKCINSVVCISIEMPKKITFFGGFETSLFFSRKHRIMYVFHLAHGVFAIGGLESGAGCTVVCVTSDQSMFFIGRSSIFIFFRWLLCAQL